MSLLQVLKDAAVAAAEMLSLLFVPAGLPAEPPAPPAVHATALTVVDARMEFRLHGDLAEVRTVRRLRNDAAVTVDLGGALPRLDDRIASVCVARDGRSVELLAALVDCEAPAFAGHARLTGDEAIADVLQLPAGAEAVIDVVALTPLQRVGRTYRVALPAPLEDGRTRALLVDQRSSPFLVVLPGRAARSAQLVLRPAGGPGETVKLGSVEAGVAVVLPLAGRDRLQRLALGAIEFEAEQHGAHVWTTLEAERRPDRPQPTLVAGQ